MIASFFHDLGMAQSPREDHGRLGRELCQSWFSESGHNPPAGMESILEAIEWHDTKEARIYPKAGSPPGILGILSVADDLEAMGIIGIYRYAEIYLLRGIPMAHLGTRVLENAEKRIRNLTSPGIFAKVMDDYQQQFVELTRFYRRYNQQWLSVEEPEMAEEGQVGAGLALDQGAGHGPTDLAARSEKDALHRFPPLPPPGISNAGVLGCKGPTPLETMGSCPAVFQGIDGHQRVSLGGLSGSTLSPGRGAAT